MKQYYIGRHLGRIGGSHQDFRVDGTLLCMDMAVGLLASRKPSSHDIVGCDFSEEKTYRAASVQEVRFTSLVHLGILVGNHLYWRTGP